MEKDLIIKILIFLFGMVIGNWLAIGRDKRKEFNEIADAVYSALDKEAANIRGNGAVVDGPDYAALSNLRRRLPFYNKNKFNNAVENYKKQKSEKNWKQDGYGQAFYIQPENVLSSIDELKKYTNRK
ncbi:MAG: hypothetical protein R6U40_01775 [Desulfobacterales bacterium]